MAFIWNGSQGSCNQNDSIRNSILSPGYDGATVMENCFQLRARQTDAIRVNRCVFSWWLLRGSSRQTASRGYFLVSNKIYLCFSSHEVCITYSLDFFFFFKEKCIAPSYHTGWKQIHIVHPCCYTLDCDDWLGSSQSDWKWDALDRHTDFARGHMYGIYWDLKPCHGACCMLNIGQLDSEGGYLDLASACLTFVRPKGQL